MKKFLLIITLVIVYSKSYNANSQILYAQDVYPFNLEKSDDVSAFEYIRSFININKSKFSKGIVMDNDIDISDFSKLMNTEFNTTKFNKNSFSRWSNFNLYIDDLLCLNYGIIVFTFDSKKDCEEIFQLISKKKLNRFSSIRVLTEYKVISINDRIYMFFSETPTDESISNFYNKI